MQNKQNKKDILNNSDTPLERVVGRSKTEVEDAEANALGKPFVIGLLFGATGLFGAFVLLLWALPYYGAKLLSPGIGQALFIIALMLFGIALILCGTLIFALTFNIRLPFIHRLRSLINWILFPLMRLLGIILRIPKSKVHLAFIRLNNDLAKASQLRCKPNELLVLLPHCIQKSTCPHRLTHDIQTCTRCNSCTVGPLLNLADKYAVQILIVPGGTVARKMIKEKRPKCLVAVACHRDLTSGVRDVSILPVFGVVNQRPFGPCINTSVDVKKIEEAIQMFLG